MKQKIKQPKTDPCRLPPFDPIGMKVWNPERDTIDWIPSHIFGPDKGTPIFGTGMVVGYNLISIQFWGMN